MQTIYDKLIEQTADGDFEGYLAEDDHAERGLHRVDDDAPSRHHVPQRHAELTAQTIADMFPIQQAGHLGVGQVAVRRSDRRRGDG